MIKPTIGRVVWFRHAVNDGDDNVQPNAAIISYVIDDNHVNLAVFTIYGDVEGFQNVPLKQEPHESFVNYYCEWMPYQIGQAKKQEDTKV